MSSRRDTAAALAAAIETNVAVDDLSVVPWLWANPSPPCIDIYPADPSEEDAAFGPVSRLMFWTVRARIDTPDAEGSQGVLLDLMEPDGSTSVRAALRKDTTLDGVVENLDVEGPSGYQAYSNAQNVAAWLGCEWRVRLYNTSEALS